MNVYYISTFVIKLNISQNPNILLDIHIYLFV